MKKKIDDWKLYVLWVVAWVLFVVGVFYLPTKEGVLSPAIFLWGSGVLVGSIFAYIMMVLIDVDN